MNGYDCTDLGARVDYNSILRTPTMDHHAENDYSISPYSVCKNNPVNIIDPDGQDCIVTIQWDDNGEITGVSISATVNITGKTNAEQAKELNKEAKETFKSKNMDGINVSFKINYKYVDKAPDKLKAGENVLTFSKESSSDEGGQIDNAHMNTSTNERHDGNRGTIYANGNTRTVMHETGHLLGLPDRYDKWEWLGEKHIDNHKGFEKDLMSVGNNKLLDQLYYNQYVTKAKRFDPNTKLIKSYIEIGYDRNGWLVTPYEKGGKHGSNQ